jgi:quercetin dioxygenase-like cupin family protein
MAPKKTQKAIQETMVEEPTQDLEVPFEAIKEEEQDYFEEQEDQETHNDHENEGQQLTIVLFTLKQLEVLFKMNRPDFTELVVALKGGSSKGVGFKPTKPRNFDGV